ncbi:MAG: threonine ammonia-lyase, biosynthetic [Hyperionvirus sp.]|uniref:threonine ammonia-lyase n=1 Tax=Hyperionvirus sp. TaxID=2487770 RepID=A0A3G5AAS9_9VIRU|nr:MAG: threonine ammonia-lyase, biosynthetic [Hyperionvirus sp.]
MAKLDYIKEILTSNIYDMACITPLEKAKYLSETYGNTIYLKREDLQVSNSFKIRGVYNKINNCILAGKKKFICASTGNHAYAVTIVSKKFGCPVITVMPKTTSPATVLTIEKMGAEVILHGDNYDDALSIAKAYGKDYYFVESYDDKDIIIGSGTISVEITNQLGSKMRDLTAIFVPVGGGALIAGISLYIKELYPKVKIIGVGLKDACAMDLSLKAKTPIELKKSNTFVTSVAVKHIGTEAFKLCQKYVDEIILVNEDEICGMIKHLYNDIHSIVEPACAMAMMGLAKYIDRERSINNTFAVVLSGNNLEFEKLKYITERANIGDKSEILVRIDLEETPGSLIQLLRHIDNDSVRESNISKFHYRYQERKIAKLYVGFSTECELGTQSMMEIINQKYKVEPLDSKIINQYIPYLIGGSNKKIKDEYIFVITLPEKSGTLLNFLARTEHMFNITMFHYRSNGDTYGNIILGILLTTTYTEFIKTLNKITFISFTDETLNNLFN